MWIFPLLQKKNQMHVTHDAPFIFQWIVNFHYICWYNESVFCCKLVLLTTNTVMWHMWRVCTFRFIYFVNRIVSIELAFWSNNKASLTTDIDVSQWSRNARFQSRQCQEQTIPNDFHCDRNHILRNKCFIIDRKLPFFGWSVFEIDLLPLINRFQFIGTTAAN